jgi:hypothetical protein
MELWHPFEAIAVGWGRGLTFILLLCITLLIGRQMQADLKPDGMAALELAWSPEKAQRIISGWKEKGVFDDAVRLQWWDDFFLIFYSTTMALACIIVADVMRRAGMSGHALGYALAWAMWLAGLLDFIENRGVNRMMAGNTEAFWLRLSFVCAGVKFLILLAGTVYVFGGIVARFSKAGEALKGG